MKVEGFKFHGTKGAFFAHYANGEWQKGVIKESINFEISGLAVALQYGQSVFEGLKAYRAKDGRILLFRPEMNAKRLQSSSQRLLIPPVPIDYFIAALKEVVNVNKELIPAYETGGSLYLRPFVIGTETVMGVRSAKEFIFCIIATPVGSYFKDGFSPISLFVSPFDRAAPNGLGHVKSGANYAGSLLPKQIANEKGFDECLYLDPKTHTLIDEASAANIIAIRGNTFVTPHSGSILPSITNNSLQVIAKEMLKMEVINGSIPLKDLSNYAELGACGTAAVITPIHKVADENTIYTFKSHETLFKLYDILQKIQFGDMKEDYGWVVEVV